MDSSSAAVADTVDDTLTSTVTIESLLDITSTRTALQQRWGTIAGGHHGARRSSSPSSSAAAASYRYRLQDALQGMDGVMVGGGEEGHHDGDGGAEDPRLDFGGPASNDGGGGSCMNLLEATVHECMYELRSDLPMMDDDGFIATTDDHHHNHQENAAPADGFSSLSPSQSWQLALDVGTAFDLPTNSSDLLHWVELLVNGQECSEGCVKALIKSVAPKYRRWLVTVVAAEDDTSSSPVKQQKQKRMLSPFMLRQVLPLRRYVMASVVTKVLREVGSLVPSRSPSQQSAMMRQSSGRSGSVGSQHSNAPSSHHDQEQYQEGEADADVQHSNDAAAAADDDDAHHSTAGERGKDSSSRLTTPSRRPPTATATATATTPIPLSLESSLRLLSDDLLEGDDDLAFEVALALTLEEEEEERRRQATATTKGGEEAIALTPSSGAKRGDDGGQPAGESDVHPILKKTASSLSAHQQHQRKVTIAEEARGGDALGEEEASPPLTATPALSKTPSSVALLAQKYIHNNKDEKATEKRRADAGNHAEDVDADNHDDDDVHPFTPAPPSLPPPRLAATAHAALHATDLAEVYYIDALIESSARNHTTGRGSSNSKDGGLGGRGDALADYVKKKNAEAAAQADRLMLAAAAARDASEKSAPKKKRPPMIAGAGAAAEPIINTRYATYHLIYFRSTEDWDDAKFIRMMMPLASKGLAHAEFDVGMCFLSLKDKVEAMAWLKRAALRGHTRAAVALAQMHLAAAFEADISSGNHGEGSRRRRAGLRDRIMGGGGGRGGGGNAAEDDPSKSLAARLRQSASPYASPHQHQVLSERDAELQATARLIIGRLTDGGGSINNASSSPHQEEGEEDAEYFFGYDREDADELLRLILQRQEQYTAYGRSSLLPSWLGGGVDTASSGKGKGVVKGKRNNSNKRAPPPIRCDDRNAEQIALKFNQRNNAGKSAGQGRKFVFGRALGATGQADGDDSDANDDDEDATVSDDEETAASPDSKTKKGGGGVGARRGHGKLPSASQRTSSSSMAGGVHHRNTAASAEADSGVGASEQRQKLLNALIENIDAKRRLAGRGGGGGGGRGGLLHSVPIRFVLWVLVVALRLATLPIFVLVHYLLKVARFCFAADGGRRNIRPKPVAATTSDADDDGTDDDGPLACQQAAEQRIVAFAHAAKKVLRRMGEGHALDDDDAIARRIGLVNNTDADTAAADKKAAAAGASAQQRKKGAATVDPARRQLATVLASPEGVEIRTRYHLRKCLYWIEQVMTVMKDWDGEGTQRDRLTAAALLRMLEDDAVATMRERAEAHRLRQHRLVVCIGTVLVLLFATFGFLVYDYVADDDDDGGGGDDSLYYYADGGVMGWEGGGGADGSYVEGDEDVVDAPHIVDANGMRVLPQQGGGGRRRRRAAVAERGAGTSGLVNGGSSFDSSNHHSAARSLRSSFSFFSGGRKNSRAVAMARRRSAAADRLRREQEQQMSDAFVSDAAVGGGHHHRHHRASSLHDAEQQRHGAEGGGGVRRDTTHAVHHDEGLSYRFHNSRNKQQQQQQQGGGGQQQAGHQHSQQQQRAAGRRH